jgi:diamine N-acetyltransferase
MKLVLVPVTRDNLRAVCKLDAGDAGKHVAPNVMSMAQAAVYPDAWPRAIEVDGELVGFLMLEDSMLAPGATLPAEYALWRLMVDKAHQGRGIGHAAVSALIEHVRTRPGAETLLVSYVPEPDDDGLPRFYGSLGFEPTGEVDEGEVVMALQLASRA